MLKKSAFFLVIAAMSLASAAAMAGYVVWDAPWTCAYIYIPSICTLGSG
jgi:hypothetical protein